MGLAARHLAAVLTKRLTVPDNRRSRPGESAPTVGVILDLAYPAVKGGGTGWVDLAILPQKRYVVTLRHTGGVGYLRFR